MSRKEKPVHANSVAAEAVVIGGVLLNARSALPKVRSLLAAEDFYHPGNAAVFEAIVDADKRGEPIEPVTVVESMKRLGTLEKLTAFGGPDYLEELMGKVITVENVEFHAGIVAKKAERRRVQEQLSELAAKGLMLKTDDEEYLVEVEQAMLALNAQRRTGGKAHKIKATLREWEAQVGERYKLFREGKKGLVGVPTGFEHMDDLTGGFRAGDLIVMAARPRMGKTSVLVQILEGSARAGTACLIFSLEMSRYQLVERMVSGKGMINSVALRNGALEVEDWKAITRTTSDLSERPISIDDERGISISQLTSRARRWRSSVAKNAEHAIIAVDYLGLIAPDPDDRQASPYQQVTKASAALKTLAGNCDCPVIALAQLNRAVEAREDKHPQLADLRDSGAIEQDADIIGLLYRDEVYDKSPNNPHKGTAELTIAKFRGGPEATLWFNWEGRYTSFSTRWDPPEEKRAGRGGKSKGNTSTPPPPASYFNGAPPFTDEDYR
jgi:replicative DNA helicase